MFYLEDGHVTTIDGLVLYSLQNFRLYLCLQLVRLEKLNITYIAIMEIKFSVMAIFMSIIKKEVSKCVHL